MSISQTTGLSEPVGADKISIGTLGYVRARHRQRQYDLLVGEFKKGGITQADLARRLGKSPEVVSRLLARPSNLEADTFADLLFAISGATVKMEVAHPFAAAALTPIPVPVRGDKLTTIRHYGDQGVQLELSATTSAAAGTTQDISRSVAATSTSAEVYEMAA